MMPVYRFMDPLNGNNVTYNHQHLPTFKNFQPYMKGDPAMPPLSYEWPSANHLEYPVVPYPCCSYGYLPGHYGWRNSPPVCPYVLPNQFHSCGHHHPAFPQSYPVQYVPPPHYSINLPRYEFDKIVPGDHGYHCCNCPNHGQNKRSSDNVKVEEQEPDNERKNNNYFVPINQLKNHSYPIIWIPPDYLKDKEYMKSEHSEDASIVKEKPGREMTPAETQRVRPSVSDPRSWSDGVPFDLKNLGRLVGDGDGKKTQNQQNQDKVEQFPFPLIWVPYHNSRNDEEKKDNQEPAAPKKAEDPASPTSFFPVKLPEGGDKMNVPRTIQEDSGQVVLDEKKSVCQKSIPVKKVEEPEVKAHPEDSMKSELKNQDGGVGEKVSGTNAKRQPSSPTKTSKLPPVCLRVDPLPKKKNGKVASRSPSPPGTKSQQEARNNQSSDRKDSHQSLPVQNDNSGSNNNVKAKKKEGKVIPVVGSSGESESQIPVTPTTDSDRKGGKDLTMEKKEKESNRTVAEDVEKTQGGRDVVVEGESKSKGATDMPSPDKFEHKAGKKELSLEEAALLIQSAYRGFAVRRWEPLKKLKEISRVRDKVVEVRNQIETLESSFDPQKDGKQKLVIGETIMSLLLKLDTVQGLHPSLRDIRKSLARELITLQEKLDMLMVKKSWETTKTKAAKNLAVNCNVQTREAEGQLNNISSEADAETNKISESTHVKDENNASEDEGGELPEASEFYIGKQEEDVAGAGTRENPSMKCVPTEPDAAGFEIADSEVTGKIAPNGSDGTGQHMEHEDDKSADILTGMKEFPHVVIGEEPAQQEMVVASDGETESPLFVESSIADDQSVSAENTSELNLLNELPLGLIGDQDPQKNETTKMQENEGLRGEEAIDFPASELPVAICDEDVCREEAICVMHHEDSDGDRNEVEINLSSPKEEVAHIDLSEQQSMGPMTEVLPVAEPEKADGSTGHGVVEGDRQHWRAMDVRGNNGEVEATELVEREQAPLTIQNENHDESCKGGGSHGSVQSHFSDAANIYQEVDEQTKDEENVSQPILDDEKIAQKEQTGTRTENLRNANESIVLENVEEESDNASVSSPEFVEGDQEVQVVLAASPSDNQLSVKEQDVTDKRILEENQQLKEMVEKLVEAGKVQLNAISRLNGRVKDLEKKLSRKKKARPVRFKASPRSCGRQSSEMQRNRAVGTAV